MPAPNQAFRNWYRAVRRNRWPYADIPRKWRCSLSRAPFQPCSWLSRRSSSCSREWVSVSSVPSATARMTGVLAAHPAPAHRQSPRSYSLKVFAATFVLAAVEHAKANPKAAADTNIRFGQQDWASVRTPPAGDCLRFGECVKRDRWPRRDPAHQGEAGHALVWLAAACLASA
jgi:hypothetical protein